MTGKNPNRRSVAVRTSESRRCLSCRRSNALIDHGALRYCRWSREDKCAYTLEAAMQARDDLLERTGSARRYGTSPTLKEEES